MIAKRAQLAIAAWASFAACAPQSMHVAPLRAALTRPADRGPCSDFEQDVEHVWNAELKAEVTAAFVKLGVDYADRVVERVTTGMDDITANWVMLSERLCKDYLVRKAINRPDYLARSACFDSALIRQRTFARMLATPGQSYAAKALEAFDEISNKLDECQNRAALAAYAQDAVAAGDAKRSERLRETEALTAEAVLAATLEDQPRATRAAQQALSLAADSGNSRLLLEGLLASAAVELNAAHFAAVEATLQRAITLATELGADLQLAQAYQYSGQLQHERRHYREAIASYQKALTLRRQWLPANHALIAWTLDNLGAALHANADDKAALSMHEQALAIYRTAPDPHLRATADALTNLGLAYASLGDHQRALDQYNQALALDPPSQREDRAAIADTLNDMGLSYRELGDYASALVCFERALVIYRASMSERHPHIARALYNLGATYLRSAQPQLAAQALEQSVSALQPASGLLAAAHNDLGVAFGQLGQNERAASEFELALLERTKLGEAGDAEIAESHANLGIALLRAGNARAAIPQLEAALTHLRRAPVSAAQRVTDALEQLGFAHQQLGECGQARVRLAEALASSTVASGQSSPHSQHLRAALASACAATRNK